MLAVRQPSPSDQTDPEPGSQSPRRTSGRGRDDQLSSILADFAAHDPEVLLAAAEVDRSLIRLTLALPPLDRVRSAAAVAATLARFRRVER